MKDSNSPDIVPCDICGQPVDRRILCEVWKHQHHEGHVDIPADIVGQKAEHFADMMKISKALRDPG